MDRSSAYGNAGSVDDVPPPAYQPVEEPIPQGPRSENFNVKAEITIPHVNPASAHVLQALRQRETNPQAHLAVLRRFCALYNLVEKSVGSTKDEDKAANVELFLVCAESRYLSYLQLLELHYKTGQYQGRPLPLPPWYPFPI